MRLSGHIFRLDDDFHAMLIGLREVRIEDPEIFLRSLRSSLPDVIMQAFNAHFVAGPKHLQLVIQQSWEAKRRHMLYVKKFELDLLVRVACNLQISQALRTVGLRKGVMDVAVIAIGKEEDLQRFNSFVEGVGKVTNRVFQLTTEKFEFIRGFHRFPNEIMESTLCPSDTLSYVLAEKAAILKTQT